MARPTKILPRSRSIGVRFDDQEHAILTQKAAAVGLRVAEFLRVTALGKRLPKSEKIDFDKLNQLRQITVDINNLRRLATLNAMDRDKLDATLQSLNTLLEPLFERAYRRSAEEEE